jgi:hypothetical protein
VRLIRLLLLVVPLSAVVVNGRSGWTPLWNGKDLDGWTTWMRQPEAGSDVVMRLHGPMRIDGDVPAPVTAGQIILQSEGAEVFFREIEIRSITAIPPEFAVK